MNQKNPLASSQTTPVMKRRYESALKELEKTKARLHAMISLNAELQLDKVRLERALRDIMQSTTGSRS